MEASPARTPARPGSPQAPAAQVPAAPDAAPVPQPLDLSRLEPPRKLAEARLEEVTIDGICGVY
jgi:mycofactocin precursor